MSFLPDDVFLMIKTKDGILRVIKMMVDPYDKATYYWVEGRNEPYCSLDEDVEEL